MLREELIEKISKYFKLVDSEAEKVFDDIFSTIMEGVKNNKVVDLDNFGEFIIKYNGHGRSVEFLAKQQLDDELNNSLAEVLAPAEHQEVESGQGSIEEELRRKREAILNKLSTPVSESQRINKVQTVSEQDEVAGALNKTDEIDDESKKSFSDYFSAIGNESSVLSEERTEEERVIPPNVVELHKEIVNREPEKETITEESGSLTGYYTRKVTAEQRTGGRPYYIWYKDSEPSPQETESMSIEYELLYQAQKEAEYRSKLKIYVTTFILFFSFVLILLIFSPLIYKVFFTPQEAPVELIPEETMSDEPVQQNTTAENPPPTTNSQTEQPKQQTSSQQNITQTENTNTQPIQTEVQQQTPQNNTQQPEQTQTQATETPSSSSLVGLTKNSLGWTDEKYRVIYILLDNNKYTIQESAWDSEVKANKRLRTVQSLNIPGLTGSIVKADLAARGVWYRTRFGEFSSIEEARKKAIELRNKEGMKITMLLYFLFFT